MQKSVVYSLVLKYDKLCRGMVYNMKYNVHRHAVTVIHHVLFARAGWLPTKHDSLREQPKQAHNSKPSPSPVSAPRCGSRFQTCTGCQSRSLTDSGLWSYASSKTGQPAGRNQLPQGCRSTEQPQHDQYFLSTPAKASTQSAAKASVQSAQTLEHMQLSFAEHKSTLAVINAILGQQHLQQGEYLFVSRTVLFPTSVAHSSGDDARLALESQLYTPKAPSSEGCQRVLVVCGWPRSLHRHVAD